MHDNLFHRAGQRSTSYAIMAAIAPPSGGGGGYDYQFVKTPSDTLICTVCFLPSKQPYLSECCGHTFCKSCLEGSKKFSNICPMCRSEDFKAIFNKQADRVIRSLHVFCINKEQGCGWQGEVNNITNHCGNCRFQIVHCPRESLQRQYLTIHVEIECPCRRVNCLYCNDVGEYRFIEGQHKEECLKFPIQCPNKCEIKYICRDEVETHREICPLERVQCDYHVIGCKVKMARKDINTHKQEMMEVHLSLSINELMETKRQLKSAQLEVEKTNHKVEKTKDDLTQQLVWHTTKVAKVEHQLTASQQEAKNQLLQKLTATEKELNTTKQQLATTCQNLRKAEKEHTTLAASTDKALTEMENKFQAKITEIASIAEKKITQLETKLQQKAKQLQEKIDPWFIHIQYRASKLSSGDQAVPVVVKMTEFAKHMGTDWLSKPFYSDYHKDCELQLKVLANKDDPTYMSVHLNVTTKYIHSSKKPVEQFVVRLLNQISDSEHHHGKPHVYAHGLTSKLVVSVFKFIHGDDIDKFISYEHLQNNTATCQFLRYDTLFFEVLLL